MKAGTYYAAQAAGEHFRTGRMRYAVWLHVSPRHRVQMCVITAGGRTAARAVAKALNSRKRATQEAAE